MSIFTITSVKKQSESMINAVIWIFVGTLLGSIVASVRMPIYANSEDARLASSLFVGLLFILSFASLSIIQYLRRKKWLERRTVHFLRYATQENIRIIDMFGSARKYVSATMLELGSRDQLFTNVCTKDNWTFGDYSFAIYERTKHGERRVATVSYAVCYIQLERLLPNIFFDAKATKGKEYRKLFDDSQLHSLEGNFDSYFDTYFTTHYTIDSLSFITPEVMQAIVGARDYDIEISGSRLYLYAPLRAMPEQLTHMTDAAKSVYDALLNNIKTYRDERVAYVAGREVVSVAGLGLRRGLFRSYAACTGGGFLIACSTVAAAYGKLEVALYAFCFGLSLLITSTSRIMRELALRDKADAVQRQHEKMHK